MVTLIAFLFNYVFAATLGTGTLQNGFAAKKDDPKSIQVSVLDQEQADRLFKKFAANKKISFKYLPEGCYARATVMNEMAEKENIVMGRIYAEGNLHAKADYYPFRSVNWGWHTAPVAFIRQTNGYDLAMVFDPSLFSKPVTVAEWIVKMSENDADGKAARLDKVYYGSRNQYYGTKWEANKNEPHSADLNLAKQTNEVHKRLEDSKILVVPYPAEKRSVDEKGAR